MHLLGSIVNFWEELFARLDGPMHLRFFLQPMVAAGLAIRDGFRDAARGRAPYLWSMVYHPAGRRERLKEGAQAISRVMAMGAILDAIYQLVIGDFQPLQLVVVVLLLAFVPYLLLRGPALRIGRLLRGLRHTKGPTGTRGA